MLITSTFGVSLISKHLIFLQPHPAITLSRVIKLLCFDKERQYNCQTVLCLVGFKGSFNNIVPIRVLSTNTAITRYDLTLKISYCKIARYKRSGLPCAAILQCFSIVSSIKILLISISAA